jgi:hypothetical protein
MLDKGEYFRFFAQDFRSQGLSCGAQIFNFALPFLRVSCRRCTKLHVVRWSFYVI